MPEIAFALAPRQNSFFVEIVDALRDELAALGVPTSVWADGIPPPERDRIPLVVPPHEWFALTPQDRHPAPPELARAIFLCAEQPGTWFFDEDVRLAHLHGAAVLDVSAAGVAALRERGIWAEHAPLGWTRRWACEEAELGAPRDLDVLHLGIWSRRRAEVLARCGATLAAHRSRIVLSDPDHPNAEPDANYVVGDAKWALLRRTRVLLNLHVADRRYFEWQRVAQAIGHGAVVVGDHSEGVAPLEPGEHFLSARPEALALVLEELLADEPRRQRMARAAYELLRDELPLRRTAELIAATAEARAGLDLPPARPRPPRAEPARRPPPREERFPSQVTDEELGWLRAALKDVRLELLDQRRTLERLRRGGPGVERVAESAAWSTARPIVTVIVPTHEERASVAGALGSCVDQTLRGLEVIVVDDGSADGTPDHVRRWAHAHEDVPLLLLRHPVNLGVGAARNTAVDHARGRFAFLLDADNALFPTTLERLVAALDERPEAAFAYAMLAMERNGAPIGLRSCFPWRPRALRSGNPIDAMALWRTEALRGLGGYTTDLRLHGWEDYDLFCRVAERGGEGVFVPEILGRYRVRGHSMLSITDISTRAAVSLLIERHPNLMKGVQPPL
ncbi:MAG TPA: glycosyltransferase family 2 protein [Solirubrobacteraceae bacterium]|nr:glycosyltransferase family 2 protein [Solirubrobacteraceae bacterium]